MSKVWREAASLIVVARDLSKNVKFDYKVLTFKRTEKTSFMPNSICFPGGAIDKLDESKDWINFMKKNNINHEPLKRNPLEYGIQKPFIFNNKDPSTCIDRDISLRLTAIRETFEELGVVLCHDKSADNSPFSEFFHSKDCDIVEWQNKIHSHKVSLLGFCEKFNLVPDIKNVFEWSVWLTPTFLRPKRFETAFYLVALNSIPSIYPESHEVQEYMWETPEDLLIKFHANEFWLPPPQYFELKRLNGVKKIDDLVKFAQQRNKKGSILFMPHQLKVKDGFLHVLPGDDLYPKDPNFDNVDHNVEEYADKTFTEMRNEFNNYHRFEQKEAMNESELICNVDPPNEHLQIDTSPLDSKQ